MCCDKNGLHEAAMVLVPVLMKETAATALTKRLSLKSRVWHGSVKEGLLTCHIQVVNHLLGASATNSVITEANTEIVHSRSRQTCVITIRRCSMDEDVAFLTGLRRVRTKNNVRGRLTIFNGAQEQRVWSRYSHSALQKPSYKTTSLIMLQEYLKEYIHQIIIGFPNRNESTSGRQQNWEDIYVSAIWTSGSRLQKTLQSDAWREIAVVNPYCRCASLGRTTLRKQSTESVDEVPYAGMWSYQLQKVLKFPILLV